MDFKIPAIRAKATYEQQHAPRYDDAPSESPVHKKKKRKKKKAQLPDPEDGDSDPDQADEKESSCWRGWMSPTQLMTSYAAQCCKRPITV